MRYKKGRLAVVAVLVFGFVAVMNTTFSPMFYYNTSASIPKGLYYSISYDGSIQKGDIVVFNPPSDVAEFACERGYLPNASYPMMKKVAATGGDEVSSSKGSFFAAGICLGPISSYDSEGRELKAWPYNHYIVHDDEFIAVGTHERSWDSRYYGPIPMNRIITKVKPLYIDED